MKELRFEDIKVGDSAHFERTINEEDVMAFSSLTGDKNPLHMDDEYARTTRFGGRVTHGLLTNALLSTLAGMHIPGRRSVILSVESRMPKPVRINDTLTVHGTVEQVVPATS